MTPEHGVAVTGMGVRSAAGSTPAALWESLLRPRPAARLHAFGTGTGTATATGTGTDPDLTDAACVIPDFDPESVLTPKETRRADRSAQLAVCAATDAVRDAGGLSAPPVRCAVVTGTGYGGVATQEAGVGRPGSLYSPQIMNNAGAFWITTRHTIEGPSLTVSTACASGTHAVGEGMGMIRSGAADVVVAGGHEAPLTDTTLLAFRRARALADGRADPAGALRPFDTDRQGFVLAECAAFVVLERLSVARARGARVLAELTGYGRTSDAHHLTAPHPRGTGARACIERSLADAGVPAEAVAHVNAHATGTELNDLSEASALEDVFGAGTVPVTASKAVTGHAIGAAGALETVIAVLSVSEGLAPPTANLTRIDPRCAALDVVTDEPRKLADGPVLTTSFAFGGHNACLVLRRADP